MLPSENQSVPLPRLQNPIPGTAAPVPAASEPLLFLSVLCKPLLGNIQLILGIGNVNVPVSQSCIKILLCPAGGIFPFLGINVFLALDIADLQRSLLDLVLFLSMLSWILLSSKVISGCPFLPLLLPLHGPERS